MTLCVNATILGARFRSPVNYELVPFERLSPTEGKLLNDLHADPSLYGVLVPRDGAASGIKAVGYDIASLLRALDSPGLLPRAVRRRFGNECVSAVAQLVLDDMLEIEWEGAFVSGARAYWALFDHEPCALADDRIARLSTEALQYAQSLHLDDAHAMSQRLYGFNTQPASPEWCRRFPTAHAIAAFLELDRFGATADLVEVVGAAHDRHSTHSVWWSWRSRGASHISEAEPVYKLYVSPTIDGVRDVFRAVVGLMGTDGGAISFKVGRDVYALLRPDKLVVYFAEHEALARAAERLHQELVGVPPQGVPFSAELAGDGLLSWGIDPPASERLPGWRGSESWRFWITNRLATSLLAAQRSPATGIQPWQFALQRIGLDGVEPDTWTLSGVDWADATRPRGTVTA